MILAIFPVDWQLHDTYFVVAHMHFVLFGGSVFGIFAGLYYWFPKMSDRMLSEGLGKLSFWLMAVGLVATFLVQHSLGLEGMPCRVDDWDSPEWEPYNLISTIGAFVLGLGIAVTLVNVVISLVGVGGRGGNDPWQGNTLEWFVPSPPPPNNFDVIPRVRSVEPMKDIRQHVREQNAHPRDPRPAAGARRAERWREQPQPHCSWRPRVGGVADETAREVIEPV